jgi:hypothetical protein
LKIYCARKFHALYPHIWPGNAQKNSRFHRTRGVVSRTGVGGFP